MARGAVVVPTGFADSVLVRGLDFPVAFAFAPDGRVFVAEQKSSAIHCVAPASGAVAVAADSLPGTEAHAAEGGLLGLAVDPLWPARPYLYTFATVRGGTMRIARYAASGALGDPASAAVRVEVASRRDILAALRDSLPNHNGGTLRFGPDGMLYASVGDDEDPCAAQQVWSLRGAVLRLDVARVPDAPGPAPSFETLRPADTPPTADPREALSFAHGLRNPFRFAIDPLTGVVYAGDVGESDIEELDRIATRGFNGAWPLREGPRITGRGCTLHDYILSLPDYAYDRTGITAAIVAAGVARAPAAPSPGAFPASYDGAAFVLDYYQGFVRAVRGAAGPWSVPGMADSANGDWGRGFASVADAQFGPDGAWWYCRQASPRFTPHTGELGRVRWTGAPPTMQPALEVRVLAAVSSRDDALRVAFTLPSAGATRVVACDATGRVLCVLADGVLPAGPRVIVWDRRDARGGGVARGVVLVRVSTAQATGTARAVLF